MVKINKIYKKIISIVIVAILFSTSVFAVYRAFTIGNKSLRFSLLLSNGGTAQTVINAAAPKLIDGMIPVVWDEIALKWKVTTSSDPNWYNYGDTNLDGTIDSSEKKWANVMMLDTTATTYTEGETINEANLGSMFVWIPRFEYKITYYTDINRETVSDTKTTFAKVDVNFVESGHILATPEYLIHPAFRNGTSTEFVNGEWSEEIDGFWMAKFEASGTTSAMKIVPNKNSIRLVSIQDAYVNSLTQTYGITTNANLLNSHMTKNSEWGAAALFSYSKYGTNGMEPYVNNYLSSAYATNTGYAGATADATRATTITAANKYDKTAGLNASTTYNIYGIYDMVGGRNEFVAAVHTGGVDEANPFTTNASTKFKTMYSGTTGREGSKPGDAVYEMYNVDGGGMGNTTPTVKYMSAANGYFLMRGGGPTNGGNGATLFGYFVTNGESNNYRGFRTVLVIE